MIVQAFSGEVEVASNLSVNTNTLHVDTQTSKVGIGKTNPSYNLDVNGTLNASSLYINGSKLSINEWSSSGSDIYYTNGNVGFGKYGTHELSVADDMRISNTSNASTYSDLSGVENYTILQTLNNGSSTFGEGVSITPDSTTMLIGQRGQFNIYDINISNNSITLNTSITNPGGSTMPSQPSVSADGDVAVISTYSNVLVYEKSGGTWSFQSAIDKNSVVGNFDIYPVISNDGNYIVLGSPSLGSNTGSANVFTRSGTSWDSGYSIAPSDGGAGDDFGLGVDISGDGTYVIVGAPYHNGGGLNNTGTAYIFVKSGSTWTEQAKLDSSDRGANDLAGMHVAISDDGRVCAVGAPNAFKNGGSNGAVYIYTRDDSTWTYQTQILHPRGASGTEFYFGEGVALTPNGRTLLITAPSKSGYDIPSAFIYKGSGSSWTQVSEITTHTSIGIAYYDGIAISDRYAVLGSPPDVDIFYKKNDLTINSSLEVNGSLTSFTGQHVCHTKLNFETGLIVSANKNKYVNLNGSVVTGKRAIISDESLPIVSLSNTVNDKNVFGVACSMEESGTLTRKQENGGIIVNSRKELGDDRVVVNSLGEGAVWVVNTNGSLSSGDYITSSNVPGYGQKQDDDVLHNYTVAKITMDCDFNPLEQPVQIIKKDENGVNVLNSEDLLQWEDHPTETEKAYQIKYLTSEGIQTDQANAVHIAAFVGCTYHCG